MKYTIKENQLNYETYYTLRKSVEWNSWSKEQAEKGIKAGAVAASTGQIELWG